MIFVGIADRQVRAHVDIGAGRHRIVEREDGVGERLDDGVVGGAGMVALEDRAHEFAVDRPPVLGAELGQPLAALGERRGALAGPHHGVEREPRDHVRVALREQGRAQRARRNPVDHAAGACRAASGYSSRRRSSRRRRRRWGRCCRGSWWSGRSPPCRRTRCRSRARRRNPSPRNRRGPAPAGRRSAARPWTSRARTGSSRAGPEGSPACLFQRNRRTSPPLLVQCSSPRMTAAGETGLFMRRLRTFVVVDKFTRGGRRCIAPRRARLQPRPRPGNAAAGESARAAPGPTAASRNIR